MDDVRIRDGVERLITGCCDRAMEEDLLVCLRHSLGGRWNRYGPEIGTEEVAVMG